jgi:hypothetical protein
LQSKLREKEREAQGNQLKGRFSQPEKEEEAKGESARGYVENNLKSASL